MELFGASGQSHVRVPFLSVINAQGSNRGTSSSSTPSTSSRDADGGAKKSSKISKKAAKALASLPIDSTPRALAEAQDELAKLKTGLDDMRREALAVGDLNTFHRIQGLLQRAAAPPAVSEQLDALSLSAIDE